MQTKSDEKCSCMSGALENSTIDVVNKYISERWKCKFGPTITVWLPTKCRCSCICVVKSVILHGNCTRFSSPRCRLSHRLILLLFADIEIVREFSEQSALHRTWWEICEIQLEYFRFLRIISPSFSSCFSTHFKLSHTSVDVHATRISPTTCPC